MKSSEKLSQRIDALRAELATVRAAEKHAATAEAERTVTRAIATSGLLAAVRGGRLTSEQLAAGFRAITERAGAVSKPAAQMAATEPAADAVKPSQSAPATESTKHLWGRR